MEQLYAVIIFSCWILIFLFQGLQERGYLKRSKKLKEKEFQMLVLESTIEGAAAQLNSTLNTLLEPLATVMEPIAEAFEAMVEPMILAFNAFFNRVDEDPEAPAPLIRFIKTKKETKDEYSEEEKEEGI